MKNIVCLLVVLLVLLLLAVSSHAARIVVATPQVDPGTTNTVLVDCRDVTAIGVTAFGVGVPWNYDTVTITNGIPTNGSVLGISFASTNFTYLWTNLPPVTNITTSTNVLVTIGATNGDPGTAGSSITLKVDGFGAMTYPIVNYAGSQQISANINSNVLTTNIFNLLTAQFPMLNAAWVSARAFTLAPTNGVYLSFNQTGTDFTNLTGTVITTNIVITQPAPSSAPPYWLVVGTNVANSATNFAAALKNAVPSINAFVVATNQVAMQTYGIGLAFTNSVGWATTSNTTNSPLGNITITAASAGDTLNFVAFPSLNLTLPLSTNGATVGTNSLVYGSTFMQFTIVSPSTNGACPGFRLTPSAY